MMVSLLDVYEDLPEDEREILAEPFYRIRQWRRAESTFLFLPEQARKHYIADYSPGLMRVGGRSLLTFMGLVCNWCRRRAHCGHKKGCPVEEVMPPGFDYEHWFSRDVELK